VTILPDINTPGIPSLKRVLAAAKKPVHNLGMEALGPLCDSRLQTAAVLAATMDRKHARFAADSRL